MTNNKIMPLPLLVGKNYISVLVKSFSATNELCPGLSEAFELDRLGSSVRDTAQFNHLKLYRLKVDFSRSHRAIPIPTILDGFLCFFKGFGIDGRLAMAFVNGVLNVVKTFHCLIF